MTVSRFSVVALALVVALSGWGCSRRGGDDPFDEGAGGAGSSGGRVGGPADGAGGATGTDDDAPPAGEQLSGFVFTETVAGRVERRIRAETMTTGADGKRHLRQMRVEYFPPDGFYSIATAAEGVYDEASQELSMRGDARLSVAWGASLMAPMLHWDRLADRITAPAGAQLRYGSRSFMVADRLEARPSLGAVEMWEASGSIDTGDVVGPGDTNETDVGGPGGGSTGR